MLLQKQSGARPIFWIALGAAGIGLALSLFKRKDSAMPANVPTLKLTDEQKRIRLALRAAASRYGLNPDFVDAIGYVESKWKLNSRSTDPRDEARGGSFGPTQISKKTAQALGFKGNIEDMRKDADLAAQWTGIILADSKKRKPLVTLADYAAAWNAGKDDADKNNDGELEELPPTHITRKYYLPQAKFALAIVRKNPVTVNVA